MGAVSRFVIASGFVLGVAHSASAQDSFFDKINLDKLQLGSLGISIGRIQPSQVEATTVYAVQADYGEILPGWHVAFGVSYWESRYEDDVVRAFADSLQKSLSDPTAHVVPSAISLYDVTFGADVRKVGSFGSLKPFAGVGMAAHVINAEGTLIKGTFVERSLDDIAAGLYVTAGASYQLLRHFGVDAAVRADLLSGFRSTQVKAGGTYYFGRVRKMPQ